MAPFCVIEQSDFVVRFAKCVPGNGTVSVELVREFPAHEAAAIAEAVTALVPPGDQVICAVRPACRRLNLVEGKDASGFPDAKAVQAFVSRLAFPNGKAAWVACRSLGKAVDARWLVEGAGGEAVPLSEVVRRRSVSGALATVSVTAELATEPVWVLDLGHGETLAVLVSGGTAVAAGALSLNQDTLAGAIQAELGLKFRGSAAKLFLNEQYDFSEAGCRIAGRLLATVKSELAGIRGTQPEPKLIFAGGLRRHQQWLIRELATGLGVQVFDPVVSTWSQRAKVSFPNAGSDGAIGAECLSLFQLARARIDPTVKAQVCCDWSEVGAEARTPVTGEGKAAVLPAVVPTPAVTTVPGATSVGSKPLSQPAVAVIAEAKSAPERPAAAAAMNGTGAGKGPSSLAPLPVVIGDPKPVPTPVNRIEARVAPAPAQGAKAPVARATVETSAVRYGPPSRKSSSGTIIGAAKQKESEGSATLPPKRGGSRRWLPLALVGACVVTLAIAYFIVTERRAEAARVAAEKARAEERARLDAERAQVAEKQAQEAAQARKQFELEAMQKLAAVEEAKRNAEEAARQAAAARLANARGALSIATSPAGATVTITGQEPLTTPATFQHLKLGRHTATISLPRHETVTAEFEVRENATTDAGVIDLKRIDGSLEITSEPLGMTYEVAPHGALFAGPTRTGRTPANLEDLAPGEYAVRLTLDGWPSHQEQVVVERGGIRRVKWIVPTGIVEVSSSPAGATVSRGGAIIGTTPLRLTEQPPGEVSYDLELPEYHGASVSGVVKGGQVLSLQKVLVSAEHIAGLTELDTLPVAISSPPPVLTVGQGADGGSVVIQVIVDRNGNATNAEVVKSTDPALARACLEAARKWRFKPGTIKGKPVKARILVPFTFGSR